MRLTALVMAGGKGSRLGAKVEKPLVMVYRRPMIEWMIRALRGSKTVDHIIVAASENTPKTAVAMRDLGLDVIQTPGNGYVEDMRHAILTRGLGATIVVAADLPFVSSKAIDLAASRYKESGKPTLAVYCPLEAFVVRGLRPEYRLNIAGTMASPVGLNIVDGNSLRGGRMLDEEILLLWDPNLAYNINTAADLRRAKRHRAAIRRTLR
jgi:adenosylcobinamide-phosphate guanylyltransferase